MEKKEYNEYIKSIKKLLSKYGKLQKQYKGLNLSGSGWKDYASASERERLYNDHGDDQVKYAEHNNKIQSEQNEVEKTISEIIVVLMKSGISADEIRKSCFYVGPVDVDEIKWIFNLSPSYKSALDRCIFSAQRLIKEEKINEDNHHGEDNLHAEDYVQDIIRHYEGIPSQDDPTKNNNSR